MALFNSKLNNVKKNQASGLAFSIAVAAYIVVALVFSIATVSLSAEQKAEPFYFYLSFFLPVPVTLITLVAVFEFTPFNGHDFLKFSFAPKNLLPLLLIFAGAFFALNKVNEYVVGWLESFGYSEPSTALPEFTVWDYIECVVIICALPAIFEEALFRGVILGGIKEGGIFAALLSAALFAIYHMSPSKTVYQFIMGLVFALIAIKTDSMMPSALVHFLNNFLVVTLNYFAPDLFSNADIAPYFIVFGLLSLAAGLVLLFVFNKENKLGDREKIKENKPIGGFLLFSAVGRLGCATIWIAGLIA